MQHVENQISQMNYMAWVHQSSMRICKFRHNCLVIPSIIMTASIGCTELTTHTLGQEYIAVVALCSTTLATVASFMQLVEKATAHHTSMNDYLDLSNKTSSLIVEVDKGQFAARVADINTERERIRNAAPALVGTALSTLRGKLATGNANSHQVPLILTL